MPTPAELAHWFSGQRLPKVDADPLLAHLHRTTAPRPAWPELNVMAFDHRSQFVEMAQAAGAPLARIPALKQLLLRAAEVTGNDRGLHGRLGVLIDGRYGSDTLNAATGRGWWVGRPVELPGSRPLAFDGTRSLATTLIAWPREQVVKCLVHYHPDDAAELRVAQEERLLELWEATRASGHELLLEVIPPPSMLAPGSADAAVLRAVKRFYNLGLKPEWWKLAPMASASWAALAALIAERDPQCRGAVVLGLNQPFDELVAGFAQATHPVVKGFMVGRTIWGEASRDWLAGRIDDATLIRAGGRAVRPAGRRLAADKGVVMSQDTVRLTMAQALVAHLAALRIEQGDGNTVPYCAGVWAIFGHGNVAGLGEALGAHRDALPTWRAHNEQAMAHAAIAFAKANFRQRIMAVTTSIGPGATNLLTAAALAHVNRLPLLLLPGDVFASRAPDPVLQQVEDFAAGDISANDAFRPLVRYFDRLTRPEQILTALPRAIAVMTDPATCGPACLALPQDVQTMAFDCPNSFLAPAVLRIRRPGPDARELEAATALLRSAKRPLVIAGGGVLYSQAGAVLAEFARRMACRWPKPRPARAVWPGTTRSTSARSASPARRRPTRWRAKPMS